ncbi:MAG: hypothetical protein QM295_07485 [Bacillota bacterium]|nr:hypothetical protein [Bacillota bacterium]
MSLHIYLTASVPFLLGGIKLLLLCITFKDSAYKIASGNSFFKTVFDIGKFERVRMGGGSGPGSGDNYLVAPVPVVLP